MDVFTEPLLTGSTHLAKEIFEGFEVAANFDAKAFIKKSKKVKTILFVAKKDKTQELWNGKRLGADAAKKRFLVDEVYEYEEFNSKLKEYLKGKKELYYDFNLDYSKVKVLNRYSKEFQSFKNIWRVPVC